LRIAPQRTPWRPAIGFNPQISDAELVTLAVMQALLGFTSESRWLRFATAHLHHVFPYRPQQPGYTKRLRTLTATINWLIGMLARDTSLWTDDVWPSTPLPWNAPAPARPCAAASWPDGPSTATPASHSRYFWGRRLHLLATLHGLPVGFALTGAKADERTVLLDLLHTDPTLSTPRPGQIIIGDKNYFGTEFETTLAEAGLTLLRPARKGEPNRAGSRFFKPLRQTIESIFDTYKGQLNLEHHGGKTPNGVLVRVLQRILALTTAIWHNDHTGQPIKRSLLAYDH
jgi:hypothetical protein